jgi:hypothetical protein
MSFENVRFHALSENSKINKRIIGFISFKWIAEYGTIGFNSMALMEGVKGLCVSFPHTSRGDSFDYFYFTGELKDELTRLSIAAYEDWTHNDIYDNSEDGNYVDTLDGDFEESGNR